MDANKKYKHSGLSARVNSRQNFFKKQAKKPVASLCELNLAASWTSRESKFLKGKENRLILMFCFQRVPKPKTF